MSHQDDLDRIEIDRRVGAKLHAARRARQDQQIADGTAEFVTNPNAPTREAWMAGKSVRDFATKDGAVDGTDGFEIRDGPC
jgi:hypothetical protein